jgi:NitT/TauT family transport system ATP-binding protein
MLKAAENKRLEWEVVRTALGLEFPADEAERQLDTAVAWGRYAEIVAYEDNMGLIYLEPAGRSDAAYSIIKP